MNTAENKKLLKIPSMLYHNKLNLIFNLSYQNFSFPLSYSPKSNPYYTGPFFSLQSHSQPYSPHSTVNYNLKDENLPYHCQFTPSIYIPMDKITACAFFLQTTNSTLIFISPIPIKD